MRPIRAVLLAVVTAAITALVVYAFVIRPRIKAWGVAPGEADLPLPGDELISEPSATETRGITIDAPVAKVWPWLVQMGFGRAGWYSYDVLDNKRESAESILPEFQTLAAGDIMPTHPTGGFMVKAIEPERALVLYTDTELVKAQADKAQAEGRTDLPDFAASWAFFLESTDDGTTRLIERFRARTPGNAPANAILGEVMGTGIVLMTRKQMLGIKERVERLAAPIVEIETPQTPETAETLEAFEAVETAI